MRFGIWTARWQRLGDTDSTTGVGLGLGLAVSRGLTEAMRGTLQPAQTPGGGLTMTMSLPAAPYQQGESRSWRQRAHRDSIITHRGARMRTSDIRRAARVNRVTPGN
jgi:hypothetical protein